ncbi:hypothetical protein TrLO_g3619 [Triparma laevis f. longispina]|nr:hypothetical protein TrLO_g3619 [Triparma laevis f. longispina]
MFTKPSSYPKDLVPSGLSVKEDLLIQIDLENHVTRQLIKQLLTLYAVCEAASIEVRTYVTSKDGHAEHATHVVKVDGKDERDAVDIQITWDAAQHVMSRESNRLPMLLVVTKDHFGKVAHGKTRWFRDIFRGQGMHALGG